MKRKLQIFISSTHDDLVEERQKIMQTILKAGSYLEVILK